jgi:quinol monooxygenase YgiN
MIPNPASRRLRVYTFDPSLATRLDTALINEVVLPVTWEDQLRPGPVGDYIEIIDFDPASDCFYAPVDLNDPRLLAQDGFEPSEGNPQFHQQMVYAVAMTTIQSFERALGRKALWAPRIELDAESGTTTSKPVARLRVYPHALREANAYYSPTKKALLFGYFPALLANPDELLPGGLVFTCLSYDVVAHETTHALLDGLHRYFAEPSNPDVLAFHEAFADIVALFQHFTHPDALKHQIARTRGDLAKQNLLGGLAHQFGQAIGNRGALRDAIGFFDKQKKQWVPREPDPAEYATTHEPHGRGAILVAAMFDAFLAIYKQRIEDLLRIATGGTGILPGGDIHPDLVNRMATEASKTAGHVLRIAIRALDYCPPVDITFGEYLRAMVTADTDLVPDDTRGYRIALIEAFRRRGIYPRGVRTLAADELLWNEGNLASVLPEFGDLMRRLKEKTRNYEWQTRADRNELDRLHAEYKIFAHGWIRDLLDRRPEIAGELGLVREWTGPRGRPYGSLTVGGDGKPAIEVHSVRSTRRQHQSGQTSLELVVEITQRRRGYLEPARQQEADEKLGDPRGRKSKGFQPDFWMRGGCTLLINSETGEVRYCIRKSIASPSRLERQRAYARGESSLGHSLRATYSGTDRGGEEWTGAREPFAVLHRTQ